MKSILFFIVDRANYGRLYPLIDKALSIEGLVVKTCFTGTTVKEENGYTINNALLMVSITYIVEGESNERSHQGMIVSMAEISKGVGEILKDDKPDIAVIIGDRYEALGCDTCSFHNVKIHIQGGEISASIDDSIRHAITKLSNLHLPSTDMAAKRIRQMGEAEENVINCGCPVGDILTREKK